MQASQPLAAVSQMLQGSFFEVTLLYSSKEALFNQVLAFNLNHCFQ
jgi:hypothetical protein